MIEREQIKAARAMLDWSQKLLAEKCGISEPTVKMIENGRINSTPDTLGRIQDTLENAGLEFLPQKGVRFRDDLITVIERMDEQDNIFLRLLDDVYYCLKKEANPELLYSFVDNSLSPREVTEKEKFLRSSGIRMRSLIKYGDKNLFYPADEYRYLPKGHYVNNPTLVYGNNFATIVNRNARAGTAEHIIIIRDKTIALTKRTEFEIIWSVGEQPK
jgi:transcriptional regulator with XRE-family HTH domain